MTGYRVLSEILQPLTGRGCDPWDAVADTTGVLVAMLLARLYLKTTG